MKEGTGWLCQATTESWGGSELTYLLSVLSLKESVSMKCHLDTVHSHPRERPSIEELPRSHWLVGVNWCQRKRLTVDDTIPKQITSGCIRKSAKHEPRTEPERESPSSFFMASAP